jgi:cytosine/uracil/thiamine/allantoin permease
VHWLYDYAWFVGFFLSGGLYVALMRSAPVPTPVSEFAGEEV